jgi:hypothetical protein
LVEPGVKAACAGDIIFRNKWKFLIKILVIEQITPCLFQTDKT